MTTLAERRQAPHNRQNVVTVAALWGALTLLAAGAAILQPADPVELPPTPRPPPVAATVPGPTLLATTAPGSWIGVVPNAPDPVAPMAPTF